MKIHQITVFLIFFYIIGRPLFSQQVLSSEFNNARLPYLTEDNKGNPVICWTEKDSLDNMSFYFTISYNKGISFEEPRPIPVPENVKAHNESMPKVAFKKDGSVWAFFQTQEPGGHFSSNIRFLFSKDMGQSWSGSRFISSDSTTGKSRSFFDITSLSDGEIGLIWLDHKLNKHAEGRPVFFAKTMGDKISEPVVIDKQACECCRTDLITDPEGKIHVAYRDLKDGNIRDLSYAISADNGKTFSPPVAISDDNWKIDACPHSGPAITANGSSIHAAWFTGKEGEKGIYYTKNDYKKDFAPREPVSNRKNASHPQICALKNKVIVVWEEAGASGETSFRQVKCRVFDDKDNSIITVSEEKANSSFPVILKSDNDNVIIAWHQISGNKSKVFFKTINLR